MADGPRPSPCHRRPPAVAALPGRSFAATLEHGVERPAAGRGQQPLGGVLDRSVVRDGFQPDLIAKVGVVGLGCRHAAMAEAEELLEHQASEALRLGELLGAEPVPGHRRHWTSHLIGDLEHEQGGLAPGHVS